MNLTVNFVILPEAIPDWANWLAIDEDGKGFWFSAKPRSMHGGWWPSDPKDYCQKMMFVECEGDVRVPNWGEMVIKLPPPRRTSKGRQLMQITLELELVVDELPEWINWIATDSDGNVFGYEEKPKLAEELENNEKIVFKDDVWYSADGHHEILYSVEYFDIINFPDWKNSLMKVERGSQ